MNAESDVASSDTSNPFSQFFNLLVSPGTTFDQLKPKTQLWFPFVLIISMQLAVLVFYMLSVDFPWMMEQSMAGSGQEFSQEQQQAMEGMSDDTMMGISLGFGSIGLVLFWTVAFALISLYYMVMSSFSGDGIKYGQWFGFNAWSAAPYVLTSLASFVSILLSENGQILQTDLNPLTFNNLLFHLSIGEPGFGFFGFIDVALIWTIALQIIGYKTWTGKSIAAASLVVAVPFAIMLGIFALISFS